MKVDEGEDEQREDGKGIRRRGRGIAAALATLVIRQVPRRWMSLFIKVQSGVPACRDVHLDGSIGILERREDIASFVLICVLLFPCLNSRILVHFGATRLIPRLKVISRVSLGFPFRNSCKTLVRYIPFADLIFTASMVNRSSNYRLSIPTESSINFRELSSVTSGVRWTLTFNHGARV